MKFVHVLTCFAIALGFCDAASAQSTRIPVVAAENFYGDVVRQLGGDYVQVTSILSNPDDDPHLFEASPKTARALQHAALIVYNGADYDPWMDKLLGASKGNTKRTVIVAAQLVDKKSGDNPHLWYDPKTMPTVARAVSEYLVKTDPSHKSDYDARLATFLDALKAIDTRVSTLKSHYKGVPVTATEPVFGYMADAIGFERCNEHFQLAAMNETEPSAADIAAFEKDLRERRVHVLIYNSQATGPMTRRMLAIAKEAHVPSISVTETLPAGKTFQQWQLLQLNNLADALQGWQSK
ncbi:Zinc ABC transporter, periplasmic-binding protein ZnuA [Candidatus Burkholderia pumila]|uniref:Zinc ABC transporter, periplasmic-binding protein ZnuA n=1 Tax=Candidatus Burkholderia pumila TaxID=1090375 RepID=A0ABR5HMG2_9BURK|nr:Zinc ABC transporter, periplasmic-binding protein ZnuA [Candidatus Burkholderia pumila]